jgi:hypothetical protein
VVDSDSFFRCPFCQCVFCSEVDLDLHLKAFGNVPHLRKWHCAHVLLEVDGFDAGVDEHGEWHWSESSYSPNTVRACRKLLSDDLAELDLDFLHGGADRIVSRLAFIVLHSRDSVK